VEGEGRVWAGRGEGRVVCERERREGEREGETGRTGPD